MSGKALGLFPSSRPLVQNRRPAASTAGGSWNHKRAHEEDQADDGADAAFLEQPTIYDSHPLPWDRQVL
jgi:hypothetical protein